MLFKQAGRAFTVEEVLQDVLLTDSAHKETFFNEVIMLTSEDGTVCTETFVAQKLPRRFKKVLFNVPNIMFALLTLVLSTLYVLARFCCTPVTVS